jgi:hypothetical protein
VKKTVPWKPTTIAEIPSKELTAVKVTLVTVVGETTFQMLNIELAVDTDL